MANPKTYDKKRGICWFTTSYVPFPQIELLDWVNPPKWAAERDENNLVTGDNNSLVFEHETKNDYALDQLGNLLG